MAPLHRAIIAVLDLALRFARSLTQFVGADVTYDVSRLSVLGTSTGRRRKSRRSRATRKNVIGFLESMHFDETESSSSGDDAPVVEIDGDEGIPHGRPSLVHPATSYISFTVPIHEEDDEGATFSVQLDKLSTDLDSMVKFIRKSVESLSVGTSEAAATFGILSFMLQDWDL
jgi:gamma-tubulin complex component 5